MSDDDNSYKVNLTNNQNSDFSGLGTMRGRACSLEWNGRNISESGFENGEKAIHVDTMKYVCVPDMLETEQGAWLEWDDQ